MVRLVSRLPFYLDGLPLPAQKNNFKFSYMKPVPVIAFFVLICACLGLPEALDTLFGWHFPLFPPFIPHLSVFWVPFVFASLVMNVAIQEQKQFEINEVFDRSDLGFLFLIIVWYAIEGFHVLNAGDDFYPEIIVSYLWVFFFYFGIKSFRKVFAVQKSIVQTVIFVSFLMSVLQFIAYFGLIPSDVPVFEIFSQRPRIGNVNRSSYVALLGICLWMFFLEREEKGIAKLYWGLMVLTNASLIMVNQTRGSVAMILALIFLKGFSLERRFLNVTILASLGVIGLLTIFVPTSIPKLEKTFSFGRGFTHETEASYKGLTPKSENQETSISVRLKTSEIMLEKLSESPLLGLGFSQTDQVKVGIHGIHVHYLFILGAYGIVGMTVLLVLIFQFGIKESGLKWDKKAALGLLVFGTMTFLREVCLWYAILGFLAVNFKPREGERLQKNTVFR